MNGVTGQRTTGSASQISDDEIDLLAIVKLVWGRKWLVLAAALVFGFITYLGTMFLIKPTYQASFTAFINNRSATDNDVQALTNGDTSAAQSLTYTYAAIMKSRAILEDAVNRAGLPYSYEAIDGGDAVSTSIENNTQLVTLYVTLEDPNEAYTLANAISEIAPGYLADIVDGTSMKIVTKPVIPDHKYAPNEVKNTVIGALLGFLLMVAVIVIREFIDDRVKSEDDLESRFGISVVGTIPNIHAAASRRNNYAYAESSHARSEEKHNRQKVETPASPSEGWIVSRSSASGAGRGEKN